MGLIKWIVGLIKWIINDIKEDFKTVGELISGKYKAKHTLKEILNPKIIKEGLKENYMMFLLLFLFFFTGWFISAKYYQLKCNEHIVETFFNDDNFTGDYCMNVEKVCNKYSIDDSVNVFSLLINETNTSLGLI